MGSVPGPFIGSWRRVSCTIGGEARDDADVLWLQAGVWYADLRIPHHDPGGPIEAFAGPASWSEPTFSWAHALDWIGTYPDDAGHLVPEDGNEAVLIETGSFAVDGAEVPYVERWARSPIRGPQLVATDATGTAVVVRVGDHAIGLIDDRPQGGGFAARRDDFVDGRWQAVFAGPRPTADRGHRPRGGLPPR